MKRLALILTLCLSAFAELLAQTIHKGDKFWDGEVLYTAQSGEEFVFLSGVNAAGNKSFIILRQDGNKAGEYILTQGAEDDVPPYNCLFGSRVQYVRKDGMNLLAFYPEEHGIGQVAVLTPDNLENCIAQQKYAEDKCNPLDMVSSLLMDRHYLINIHPEVLQEMLDKLNAKNKKTIIESTNQEMIAFVMAFCMESEGEGEEEVSLDEVTVADEREFLSSIKSNRIIHIKDGTVLNLTNILNDQNLFKEKGRLWTDDYYAQRDGDEQLIVSCERFDGRQIEFVNVNNLEIRGGKDCYIIVEPRYANVLNFYGCVNITLTNLTIGHTEEGYCEGGVIYAERCNNIFINNCDLYGCGTYGMEVHNVDVLSMTSSIIRDCSYGIMILNNVHFTTFHDCDFYRCREFDLVAIDGNCRETLFDNCRFAQNKGELFNVHSMVTLKSCEIHHAKDQKMGNVNNGNFEHADDNTHWVRDNEPLKARNIGPAKTH